MSMASTRGAAGARMNSLPTSTNGSPLRRRTFLAVLALLPLGVAASGAWADKLDAAAFIRGIGDEVMTILRDASKTPDEQLMALKELLDANTDLDLVAQLVLGQHWRAASVEERHEYVTLFRQMLMNTMAERIGDYNGQSFEVVGSSPRSERDTAVQSRIIRTAGAPPLRVDWRVREADGQLAIIDMEVEGISLIVSQRDQMGRIVERRGMAGLIETLRERSSAGGTVL
jgi:phospholipid transport system substrate-binding protein